jgi:cob(I)alamin adenosyltransferase
VQVYTGNGKGKTTAALGLAVRAACAGRKVYIGQFMKGSDYSELCLPGRFPDLVRMDQYGTPRLLCLGETPSREDLDAAAAGVRRIHAELISGLWDLVIADELCVTVHLGLLAEADALGLIDARPPDVELILTGRYATQALIAAADLVTEMAEVKHYYSSEGLPARKGIEF